MNRANELAFNPGPPLALALWLALPVGARGVPELRFLDLGEGLARLEVGGGTGHAPTSGEVCLTWTWKEPKPEIEIYPDDRAGTFVAAGETWLLAADGAGERPPTCPEANPFPELGLGPADELWFLRHPDRPGAAADWADLLHTVESVYRHASPLGEPPLSAITVGTYGRCVIHSIPVGLRTRLDRWLPVELPGPLGLVRVRRFLWWVEPAPGNGGCVARGTGGLRLFALSDGDGAAAEQRFLLIVEGVASRRVSPPDLDPDDRSPRVRAFAPVERTPAAAIEPSSDERDRGALLTPALAAAAAVLSLAALARSRPRWTRPHLLRLIEATVDRRLRTSPASPGSGKVVRRLEDRAAELRSDLEAHARKLLSFPPSTAVGTPEPSSAEGLEEVEESDPVVGTSALQEDLLRLEESERRLLADGLEAMSELGHWIELLWPVLREASGRDLDSVASGLPLPAAEEWRRAREILEEFSHRDAVAARRILHRLSDEGRDTAGVTADFLDCSGRIGRGLTFPERLKRYLEPFDHTGRLGRVTLALQYLLEAYPVEQLEPDRRTFLRHTMAEAAGSVRLAEDFHILIARIAAGVGLDYRAVSYYKGRLDQSEYAFVRGQVSPISLTERVGFAAATDPAVIVRLERPFFFHGANHVYYAGHAHVARG